MTSAVFGWPPVMLLSTGEAQADRAPVSPRPPPIARNWRRETALVMPRALLTREACVLIQRDCRIVFASMQGSGMSIQPELKMRSPFSCIDARKRRCCPGDAVREDTSGGVAG